VPLPNNGRRKHEVKLYGLWWQQMLLADRLSLLAGLYDLNSEFDVVDSAAVSINSSFGIGVAAAHNGSPFEQTVSATGLAPADAEIALEWTYRAVLTPWLALQPDFQYIIHPGGLISRPNAVVIGLRSEIDF
jgi:carbohydrate-selective porin OprB